MNDIIFQDIKELLDSMDLKRLSDEYICNPLNGNICIHLRDKISEFSDNIESQLKEDKMLKEDVDKVNYYGDIKRAIDFFSSDNERGILVAKKYLSDWPNKKAKIEKTIESLKSVYQKKKSHQIFNIEKFRKRDIKIANLNKELVIGNNQYDEIKKLFDLESTAKEASIEKLEADINVLDKKIKKEMTQFVDKKVLDAIKNDPSMAMYGVICSDDLKCNRSVTSDGVLKYSIENIFTEINPQSEIIKIMSRYTNEKFNERAIDNQNRTPIGFGGPSL